jgi:hypothetical protein
MYDQRRKLFDMSTSPECSDVPPKVLNRLHALFGSNVNAEAGPSRRARRLSEDFGEGIHRAVTAPNMAAPPSQPFQDRDALVIKLVTWNMGDALVCRVYDHTSIGS